jgi:two-component system phosphate regulon sensor histidine kinase PhoR
MLSFRQKIFLSYVALFLLFLALLFPFATRTVEEIVSKTMADRADELITKIKTAPNNDALIRRMKDLKWSIFFRVGIITNERKVLYDSHAKRKLGPRFSQEFVIDHPEINQAFSEGFGYYEDYSELFQEEFAYYAKSFNFHGKIYVLRVAFPYRFITALTRDFEIGFLGLATAVLLLFTIMTWFIINHLTNPIQQIIQAVRPYQEGTQKAIPEIRIKSSNPKDDFGKLAQTLNSLSAKIQSHINSLTNERNEKEAVLESLVEGVIAIDKEGQINYVNNMALKFLGIEGQNLVNKPFSTTGNQRWGELLSKCQEKNSALTLTEEMHENGRKLYLDIIASPKKAKSGAVLVIQDMTSHHKMLEMRKDFIANASHELKTPITIIRGFAEALHDNPDLPKQTQEEITGKIVKNCERMGHLVKDLLTLADIEHIQESRLTPCNVSDIIEKCVSLLNEAYPTAVVHLDFDVTKTFIISADEQLIELAIMNLLENAAKYSKPPADINISLDKLQTEAVIKIKDRGIGIPKEDLEHIFQRFYTVNKAHSRKLGGAGLGLSLVETIIKKHRGQISVDSELGIGTTFTIVLPLRLP